MVARDVAPADHPAAGDTVVYDAFLSYSHTDRVLATAAERSLRRFATPWYRTRTLRVFRDETSLSHDPSLWAAIERGLENSRWFLLIASPEAASRPWVNREVEWWLANRGTSNLLICLAKGEIRWRPESGRVESTALPQCLLDAWEQEPLWLDLRTAAAAGRISREDAVAYASIASVVAAIAGVAKDELVGEDLRQHRRAMRLLKLGIVVVLVLAVIAATAAFLAIKQRDRAVAQQHIAEENARRATAVALAVQASAAVDSNAALALALAVQSYATTEKPLSEAVSAMVSARAAFAARGMHPKGEPLTGHTDVVNDVAISPDGTLAASASDDRTIRLWSIATGEPVGEPIRGHKDSVISLAFSSDGARLTSVGSHESVRLWETATRRPIGEPVRASPLTTALNADGTRLATVIGPRESVVRVLDTLTGEAVGRELTGRGEVTGVAFSADGTRLATGEADGTVRVWNVRTGKPIGPLLTGHRHSVDALAFTPDGVLLASGGWDGTVRLWDTARGRAVGKPLTGHPAVGEADGGVSDLAFSPDGLYLASAGGDGTIRLWDRATGRPLGTPTVGHGQWVAAVAFSPDGGLLVSAGADRTVKVWDPQGSASSGAPVPIQAPAKPRELGFGSPASLAFRPDGDLLAIIVEEVSSPRPDGLGMRSRDEVQLWDVAPLARSGRSLARGFFEGPVVFSPDGEAVAFASHEGEQVELWDVASRRRIGDPLDALSPIAFSPDGKTLATGDEAARGTVALWDIASRRRTSTLPASKPGWLSAVTFSPDGRILASTGEDGSIRLWDPRTGAPLGQPLIGHLGTVNDLEFSPDGTLLASAGVDQTVRLWNPGTGEEIGRPLTGHSDAVTSLAFSPDGRIVATAGADGLRLWDPADGAQIGPLLTSRTGRVAQYADGVTFHPSGVLVASWGWLDTLRIWNVLDPAVACDLVKPYLTEGQLARYLEPSGRPPACELD